MSDETNEDQEAEKAGTPAAKVMAPPSPLQRASDQAVKPGFRNPANTRSKAQKRKKR